MQASRRISSIDLLRGWVIALMTVDHAREFFYKAVQVADPMNLATVPPDVFLTRWLTHFCAPTFVFLAGVSAYLYSQKPGVSQNRFSSFLLKRGAFLVLMEVTLISFAWSFIFPPERIYLQVIWAIGIGMTCLAGLSRLPRWAISLIVILLIAGTPLLSHVTPPDTAFGKTLWAFLYQRELIPITDSLSLRTSYPLLPWIGVMGFGFLMGKLYTPAYTEERRKRILLQAGLLMLAGFIVFRLSNGYGDNNPFLWFPGDPTKTLMSFLNVTKYPPSFQFCLMTLSATCLGLWLLENWKPPLEKALLTFGRVPMFYYILHLYLLHGAACLSVIALGLPGHRQFSVPGVETVWLIALACLLVTFPVSQWFSQQKTKHPGGWLQYF